MRMLVSVSVIGAFEHKHVCRNTTAGPLVQNPWDGEEGCVFVLGYGVFLLTNTFNKLHTVPLTLKNYIILDFIHKYPVGYIIY